MGLLKILYQDDIMIAIDKPDGILVHRTRISSDHTAVLQLLRDQVGAFVYPVHRLDRAASGVLLFGRTPDAASALGSVFEERTVEKEYLCIVRGHLTGDGCIDYALRNPDSGEMQHAVTRWRALAQTTPADAPGPYSLVQIHPLTGRRHQIRRHMKHIFHPLIGDTVYGQGLHNRYFRSAFGTRRLFLHARRLSFQHPGTGAPLCIEAPIPEEFLHVCARFGWPTSF